MTNQELSIFIKSIPNKPGVYRFEKNGKPIYIGKASSLKTRLRSYLKIKDNRIQTMISQADHLEYIGLGSEIEALILESQLIKQKRPPFNVVMRDDKQYFYVALTKEEFPHLYLTHQTHDRNVEYIGPFTEGLPLKTTLRFLRGIFPYCTCKQKHHNFCLNYHIGKCLGYCCLREDSRNYDPKIKKEVLNIYKDNIKAIKEILQGKKNTLVKELTKQMDQLARSEKLEEAIALRNKITRLEQVFQNAQIVKNSEILKSHSPFLAKIIKSNKPIRRIEGYDISNIQGKHATGSMVTFVEGQPDKNFYRKFNIRSVHGANDVAMLEEILQRRLNHDEWPYPDLIIIDGGKGQVNRALAVLKDRTTKIPVIGLVKNTKHTGRAIIIGKKTIDLIKLSPNDRNLILAIDGEAHRFAISHYRSLHRKSIN